MRVLVTGATGVLGRAPVPRLRGAGSDVRAPTRGELDLLEAVEHDEHALIGEVLVEGALGTDGLCHRRDHELRLSHVLKRHPEHSVLESIGRTMGGRLGEPGLPGASGADERHEAHVIGR